MQRKCSHCTIQTFQHTQPLERISNWASIESKEDKTEKKVNTFYGPTGLSLHQHAKTLWIIYLTKDKQ